VRPFSFLEAGYAILLLGALYVGAYFLTVEPGIEACIGPENRVSLCTTVFQPIHDLDRRIRPGHWLVRDWIQIARDRARRGKVPHSALMLPK
jgi:hypothetical protein